MKLYTAHYSTPYYDELKERGIRLPCFLCQIRTDEGRIAQSNGTDVFTGKFLTPRSDRLSNCLTGVQKDNLIMIKTENDMELTYHEHPTKEQLLEYFSQRIRVRKMTPREAMRLMDVEDPDIVRIMNAEETVTLKNGTVKTKKAISKTAVYKLAGNSIVVSCLYHIFRTMFIPGQPENDRPRQPTQLSFFDLP